MSLLFKSSCFSCKLLCIPAENDGVGALIFWPRFVYEQANTMMQLVNGKIWLYLSSSGSKAYAEKETRFWRARCNGWGTIFHTQNTFLVKLSRDIKALSVLEFSDKIYNFLWTCWKICLSMLKGVLTNVTSYLIKQSSGSWLSKKGLKFRCKRQSHNLCNWLLLKRRFQGLNSVTCCDFFNVYVTLD